jgi:hypothetical protein
MPVIHFETKLFRIDTWVILKLPKSASVKLPSRGQVMVKGIINGAGFQTPLEPDGDGSHWLRIGKSLQKAIGATAGDVVRVEIEPTKEWPEPDVPPDLQAALDAHPKVYALWAKVTPMARWEWLRWISSTSQPETRKRRIEVACSKMMSGSRRPCCFSRNMCCVPEVSKSGVLREPVTSEN